MTKKIDFAIGGQAVMEGVMMRSPHYISIALRKKNGEIKIKTEHYLSIVERLKINKIPILRGIINFFEMLFIGIKYLNYSAKEAAEEDDGLIKEEKSSNQLLMTAMTIFSLVFALLLGLGLFKFLPLLITEMISTESVFIKSNYWIYNLIDGLIKIVFFVTYILLVSFIPDLKRVFAYHGAEHKSVRTYESSVELSPKYAIKMSRLHPRCGTSFILFVFLISIVFYSLMPSSSDFWLRLIERIFVLPIIAGISYEFLKFSAKFENYFFIKIFLKPGLLLQKLTTAEPTLAQLEVSLAALKACLTQENSQKN